MSEDQLTYRKLMGRFVTGVAVIGFSGPDGPLGMTVNSLTSVSLDPLLLLFCVRKRGRSLGHLKRARRFSVNILASGQEDVSRHFAGAVIEGLPVDWRALEDCPILQGCTASFACRLSALHPAGDHTIVLGRVLDMDGAGEAPAPLIYYAGRYGLSAFGQTPSHHSMKG
ncbi:MAG: flavin reductase family protein [Parvibaculaceae bacterium]